MNTVKIPEEYFVARRSNGLAFITPEGTDQAAKDRKSTASNWADQSRYSDPPEKHTEYTMPNEPVEGFKLKKQVSRWSTSNVVWRVEDPRGFEIEIYSGNMYQILEQAGIVNGAIQGTYVYGREGAKNVLLPIGSDIYKKAQEHTKDIKAKKIPIKDVNIGDLCVLMIQGKRQELVYAGRYYELSTTYEYENNGMYRYRNDNHTLKYKDIISNPKHFWIDPENVGKYEREHWYVTKIVTLNILKVKERAWDNTNEFDIPMYLHNAWAKEEARENGPDNWNRKHGNVKKNFVSRVSMDRKVLTDIKNSRIDYLES